MSYVDVRLDDVGIFTFLLTWPGTVHAFTDGVVYDSDSGPFSVLRGV